MTSKFREQRGEVLDKSQSYLAELVTKISLPTDPILLITIRQLLQTLPSVEMK